MDEGSESEKFMFGNKLYQQRARKALPILVRQAQAHERIFFSDLADELGMPLARNLNYVLGSVGLAINHLSEVEDEEDRIPPIQCLVVNKQTGMPGEGVGWFFSDKQAWDKLSRREQRIILDGELAKVFTYPKWANVLELLNLSPASIDVKGLIRGASKPRRRGESEQHKKLKHYVANHPKLLGLPASVKGEEEYALPSGDRLDVMFDHSGERIVAEVKSSISDEADIVRGMFQCVKYQRVIEATQAVQGLRQSARAILILEGKLPRNLLPVKNTLGIKVIESIRVE